MKIVILDAQGGGMGGSWSKGRRKRCRISR